MILVPPLYGTLRSCSHGFELLISCRHCTVRRNRFIEGFSALTLTITDEHIHIDFNGIMATAQKGILRASAFAGFSLNAAARHDLRDFHPAGAYIRRVGEQLSDEQVQEWKDAYSKWIVGNAIRELVETFGLVLNGVYFALAVIRDGTRLPLGEIQQQCRPFEQRSELARLNGLRTEFGISPQLAPQLTSFIDVRNALTHRWGQILTAEIVARWQRIQPFVRTDAGTEIVIPLPVREAIDVKEGGELCVRLIDAERRFPIGSSVAFEPFELQEICQLFETSVIDIVRQAQALGAQLRPRAVDPTAG
jgi:bifunctional DNA-binding transcriptional regulator/antitoxin component of YhaV-PrlF toxin-antitoxin module